MILILLFYLFYRMRPPKLPGTEKFRFSQLPACEPKIADSRDYRKVKLPITSRLIRVLALTDLTLESIKDYIKCLPVEEHFSRSDSHSSLASDSSSEYRSNSSQFHSFPSKYTLLYTVPSTCKSIAESSDSI